MLRATSYGKFQVSVDTFAAVATAGGALHCKAFYAAVHSSKLENFAQVQDLVDGTAKLPEVSGEPGDRPEWHYGQVFIENADDNRIRFVSSRATEVILAPIEDDEFRITIVGNPDSVRGRMDAVRVRWYLDTVDHHEVRSEEERLRDARQEFARQYLAKRDKGFRLEDWNRDRGDLLLVLLGTGGRVPGFLMTDERLTDELFAVARKLAGAPEYDPDDIGW